MKKLIFFSHYYVGFFFEFLRDRLLNYETARSLLLQGSFFSFRGINCSTLYHLTGASLLSFLKFSIQHSVPPRSMDTLFAVNRQRFRSFTPPACGITGYRIRLHGRFTRKQIAAAYHYQEGSLSLSSLDSFIDYGFATVPLRNSAIGIKV